MIEVMIRKNRKVVHRKIYSDVQFLHQVRYRLIPGEKGRGIWADLLLDKSSLEKDRKRHLVRIPEGVLVLRYIG